MDGLLSALDVQVEPFAICDVRAGSRLSLPGPEFVSVHYALAGRGALVAGRSVRVDFAPETIIVCPSGLAQRVEAVAATGRMRCVQPAEGLRWLRAGVGSPQVLLACGRIRAQAGGGAGLFDGLAEPIAECFAEDGDVRRAFRALLDELAESRLGSRAAAGSLMKLCLIRLLRRLVERGDGRLPWLAALQDPRLAGALRSMLASPERRHSLEDLAALAGMSRSAFVGRFRAAFGEGPHAFLTGSRLQRAAALLQATRLPVKTIADRVGYRSRSHFSRAFKARYGIDPVGYRARRGARADAG